MLLAPKLNFRSCGKYSLKILLIIEMQHVNYAAQAPMKRKKHTHDYGTFFGVINC